MFGHFNQDELAVVIEGKMTTYLQEAAQQHNLPKHSFRRRIAQQLRAWAEALEPSRSFSTANQHLRGA